MSKNKTSSIKMPNKKTKDQWVGSNEEMVRLTVDLTPEQHIKFKIAATKQRKKMNEILRQYIIEYGKN